MGHFDNTQLQPLYTRFYEKYMAADKSNLMWFEPGQFPDTLPLGPEGLVLPLGFTVPPGGEIGSPNHVLNDHSYCCQLKPDICAATGEPTPEDA